RETHLLGQHAYDFERQSVDAHRLADGGRIAEELARDLGAEKDDAAFFFHVLIIDEASEFGDLAAHQRVFRGDAAHGGGGLLHAVGQRQVSDVFRAGVFDQAQLSNRFDVGFFHSDATSRAFASSLPTRLPVPDDDRAVAEGAAEPGHDRVVKSVAVSHQQHDRDDAPGDSGHRHHGAEAVADEGLKGLNKDFFDYHSTYHKNNAIYISYRNASIGGKSAARRAG